MTLESLKNWYREQDQAIADGTYICQPVNDDPKDVLNYDENGNLGYWLGERLAAIAPYSQMSTLWREVTGFDLY